MARATGRSRGIAVRLPPPVYDLVKREALRANREIGEQASIFIEAGRKAKRVKP